MRCSGRRPDTDQLASRHIGISGYRDIAPVPVVQRPDTFPRKPVSTAQGSWHVPVPIAHQARVHDETTAKHFVTGCTRAPTLSPHFHSIINETSKLLIYKGMDTASALFTVTFTVNLI